MSSKKTYFKVFFGLGVLTALELLAAEIAHTLWKASTLTFLAILKAFAVAWWFMHLKDETFWVKLIAAVPFSAVLFVIVVVLESVYR